MTDTLYISLLDSLLVALTEMQSTATETIIEDDPWYHRVDVLVIGAAVVQALATGIMLRYFDNRLKKDLAGFTLLNKLQVEAFGTFYIMLSDLRSTIVTTNKYILRYQSPDADTERIGVRRPPTTYINQWDKQFRDLVSQFKRSRYLFPKEHRSVNLKQLFEALQTVTQAVQKLSERDAMFMFDQYDHVVEGPNTPEEQDLIAKLDEEIKAYDFKQAEYLIERQIQATLKLIDEEFDKFR